MNADVIVIGGGMAGYSSALKLKKRNNHVILVKKSTGATFFSSGAIDLAGYYPLTNNTYYDSPITCINDIRKTNQNHPYSKFKSIDEIKSLYNEWKSIFQSDFQLKGSLNKNILLINFSGTVKPSNLAGNQIYDGNLNTINGKSLALIGINGFPFFDSKYCSKSLKNTLTYLEGMELNKISNFSIELPDLSEIGNLLSINVAKYLENEQNLSNFIKIIKSNSEILSHDVLAFPPILGLLDFKNVLKKLQESLGKEIIEILSYPPSVPGFRLQSTLEKKARELGVEIVNNMEIINFESKNIEITGLIGKYGKYRDMRLEAENFILATGKFIGNGIKGNKEYIKEKLFDLPIFDEFGNPSYNIPLQKMYKPKVLPRGGQPFLSLGIKINENFIPIDEKNQILYENLKAAGQVLSGYNYVSEKNGLGIALLTGMAAGGKE